MRNHLDRLVGVLFYENVVRKGYTYTLTVVIGLEKKVKVLFYNLLLVCIIFKVVLRLD